MPNQIPARAQLQLITTNPMMLKALEDLFNQANTVTPADIATIEAGVLAIEAQIRDDEFDASAAHSVAHEALSLIQAKLQDLALGGSEPRRLVKENEPTFISPQVKERLEQYSPPSNGLKSNDAPLNADTEYLKALVAELQKNILGMAPALANGYQPVLVYIPPHQSGSAASATIAYASPVVPLTISQAYAPNTPPTTSIQNYSPSIAQVSNGQVYASPLAKQIDPVYLPNNVGANNASTYLPTAAANGAPAQYQIALPQQIAPPTYQFDVVQPISPTYQIDPALDIRNKDDYALFQPPVTAKYLNKDDISLYQPPWQPVPGKIEDNLYLNGILTLPKLSTAGIKVDYTNPTYPWKTALGRVTVKITGSADPSWAIYRGTAPKVIRAYQFAVNNEVWVDHVMPYDYAKGTDIFVDFHWSLNVGSISENITWAIDFAYAKSDNQQACSNIFSASVLQASSTTQRQMMSTTIQLTGGGLITLSDCEPDMWIGMHVYLSANSGSTQPFLHSIDLQYQSTGIGTKNRDPDFYA